MNDRAKKAKDILVTYKNEISSISNVKEGNNWKAKVLNSLNLYLGSDSPLYKRFDELFFTKKRQIPKTHIPGTIDMTSPTYENVFDEEQKKYFGLLLMDIIADITSNGVKADYVKTNFLSSFSTTKILGGLLSAATLVFYVGKFVGSTEKEREITKMESHIQTIEQQKKETDLKYNEVLNKRTILDAELLAKQAKIDSLLLRQKDALTNKK